MIAYMNKVPEALQNDPAAIIEYAYGISTKYGEAAAALACEMYDAVAEASGVNLNPAIPADVAEYGEVAKAINGTRKTGNQEIIAGSIGRLVKRTGADTTIKNAIRDGAEWAWIPNGDTCAFCLMLASRGWQNASKKTLKGDHAEHIHAHCDCSFQIRFDGKTEYAGYDPDKYLEMYENAEGRTPEEKLNAMRRAQYAKNKDQINAQKRDAYKERKERLKGEESNGIINPMRDVTKEYTERINFPFDVRTDPEFVELDGKIYKINGHSIKIDYTEKEIQAAKLVSSCTGKKAVMMPKFAGKVKNISAPDFVIDNREKWDFKELKGSSSDAIRNAISKKKRQANSFVIDIEDYKLSEDQAIKQAMSVFTAYNTAFTNALILVRDREIVKAFVKK